MGTSDGGPAGRARGQNIFNNQGREQPQMVEPFAPQEVRYDQPTIISDPDDMYGNQNQGQNFGYTDAGNFGGGGGTIDTRMPIQGSSVGFTPGTGTIGPALPSGDDRPLGFPPLPSGGFSQADEMEGLMNDMFGTGGAAQTTHSAGNQGPITAGNNPYASGNNGAGAYAGAAIGGLLSGNLGGALQAAGGYYAGQKGIEGAYQTGVAGLDMAEQMGQRASDASQFKPYGVTSNLANVQTDASGGMNVGLNQQQQRMQNQLMSGAQQQFGNVNAIDPSIAAQRGAMGGMFGQQLSQQGQPTGMEGITQAGLGGAMSQFGAAGQPQDLQNLRTQYGNLAAQAGQGLLTSPEQAQNSIYESIRATQRPEEERQNLRLQEQLAAQGRSGVRTADYGGTPEQLAMAKAQAEAQNTAALQARQMGMQEQAQGLQRAQTLTGMTQNLAGMGSDLETAGIGRGATLAGVGMQGAQTGQGFDQQNLQNLMALQGADQGAAAAQQALQQGRLGMGTGMLGAGYQPQQQAMALAQLGLQGGQLAQRGQLSGAELQSQMGGRGLESYMQGGNMANLLQQQQLQGMMGSMFGNQPTAMEQALMALSGGKFEGTNGMMGSLGVGEGKTPEIIKSIGDYFGFGGKNNPLGSPLGNSSDNAVAQYILDQGNSQQSDSSKSKLDAFNDLVLGGG
jgi:hypothetical protein